MTDRALYATFTWAGGTHRFALPMEEMGGLPQRHGVNDPHPRLRRLLTGYWTVPDVSETIRGGLVGGKAYRALSPTLEAVIKDHVLKRPLAESVPLAKAILLVALFGIPADMADRAVDAATVADAATEAHLNALEPA